MKKEISDQPTTSKSPPRPARSAWWTALKSILFFTSLAVVASWGARWAWFLDLASHFRVQYAIVLTAGVLLLLLGRWFKTGLVFAVMAGTQIWAVAPFYTTPRDFTDAEAEEFPWVDLPVDLAPSNPWGAGGPAGAPLGPLPAPEAGSRRVRILEANVHSNNIEYKRFVSLVREEQPDLIAVLEFNDAWQQALAELQASYQFTHFEPRSGNFGIALYSRHMMVVQEPFQLGSEGFPALVANCSLPGGPLTVIAAHTVPPMSALNSELRNDQMEHLAKIVQRERGMTLVATLDDEAAVEDSPPPPVAVVGDFNCTSWSPYFTDMLESSGLRDSSLGWGTQATWPAKFPATLRIPIDHCLVSPELKVIERRLGPGIGSDHLPIIIDVILPPPVFTEEEAEFEAAEAEGAEGEPETGDGLE